MIWYLGKIHVQPIIQNEIKYQKIDAVLLALIKYCWSECDHGRMISLADLLTSLLFGQKLVVVLS